MADAEIARARQLLDDLARNFPRATSYQTKVARAYASRVNDLARLANEAVMAAVSDVTNVVYQEQIDPLGEALWRDVQPVLDARLGPIRRAEKAHEPTVALPGFKDQLEKALLRISATFDQLDQLNAIRPWWVKNSAPVLKALADLYEFEKHVVELAGAILHGFAKALPWVGAGVAALGALVLLVRRRRRTS